jgi:hypothetical protein
MKGCNCVGASTLFKSEVQQKKCSKSDNRAGCRTIQPYPKQNYTTWRTMQFCSKYPIETTNELKYLEYLKNSVDYIVPDYGYAAKGKSSTVIGFKDNKIVVFRQGDVFI